MLQTTAETRESTAAAKTEAAAKTSESTTRSAVEVVELEGGRELKLVEK